MLTLILASYFFSSFLFPPPPPPPDVVTVATRNVYLIFLFVCVLDSGADDLLPLLAYTIVKSGCENMFSECRYMEDFIDFGVTQNEQGYCLGTLTGIVEWLSNIDPETDLDSALPEPASKQWALQFGCNELPSSATAATAATAATTTMRTTMPTEAEIAHVQTVESNNAARTDAKNTDNASNNHRRTRSHASRRSDFASPNWRAKQMRKLVYSLAQTRANHIAAAHKNTLKRIRRRGQQHHHNHSHESSSNDNKHNRHKYQQQQRQQQQQQQQQHDSKLASSARASVSTQNLMAVFGAVSSISSTPAVASSASARSTAPPVYESSTTDSIAACPELVITRTHSNHSRRGRSHHKQSNSRKKSVTRHHEVDVYSASSSARSSTSVSRNHTPRRRHSSSSVVDPTATVDDIRSPSGAGLQHTEAGKQLSDLENALFASLGIS
jgi:Vacuolar sorting protein 9 (VPS9) domain